LQLCCTGLPFNIDEGITVIPTPGHTADDVSVVIKTEDLGIVVIAGKIAYKLNVINNDIINDMIMSFISSFNFDYIN